MKTAVSIPDHIFDEAERLVARFGTSRSELYSRALSEFIQRNDEDRITRAMDEVINSIGEDHDETDAVRARARRVLKKVEW